LNFVRRPPAKHVPQWIIAASKFAALAANSAVSAHIVIAAVKFSQFEFEQPVVVGTSGNAVPPEFLHHLMGLFS